MVKQKINRLGFTIIELAAVILVIAVLVTITAVSYVNLQLKANDTSSLSAIDAIEGILVDYGIKNNLEDAHYYSENPADVEALGYKPNDNTIVDVVTNKTDFCIRAYNPDGNKNSIYNSYTRESVTGICYLLQPSESATIQYSGDNLWVQFSASHHHTCAIDSYGRLYCWGANTYGQIGDGTTNNSNIPVAVDVSGVLAGRRIKQVTVAGFNTCVIADDNLPYCWGRGGYNGDGTWTQRNNPVAVKTSGALDGKTVNKLVASWGQFCVLASDSLAYCWGNDTYGSLGSGTGASSTVPIAVYMGGALSGKTVKDIATPGDAHNCLIASDSRIYCWGNGNLGQLGNGSTANSSVPVAVDMDGALKDKRIISITNAEDTSCAIDYYGRAYCWGSDYYGGIGNGDISTNNRLTPTEVDNSEALQGITLAGFAVADAGSMCAYSNEFEFFCWGLDDYYQLGDDDTDNEPSPVYATTMNDLDSLIVEIGWEGNCLITKSYELYCWGQGSSGRIGDGSNNDSSTPVLINPID